MNLGERNNSSVGRVYPKRVASAITSGRRQSGILLFECLVYMSIFFVVTGFAMATFYRCWDNFKNLNRNAADIANAVHAGERWREDIRLATASPQLVESEHDQAMHLSQPAGEVVYVFSEGVVRRRANTNAAWIVVLPKVKTSRMQKEPRTQVTAWRWELELQSKQKVARVKPLFTFEAVAATGVKP